MKGTARGSLLAVAVMLTLAMLLAATTASCARRPEATGEGKIGVVVTILSQAEFAEKVGGDRVEVTVMVPPGADPHTYEPTPSVLRSLSRAKMYAKVGSGVEFELAWMDKLQSTNREMLVVDSSVGIELVEMETGQHDEGEEGKKPEGSDRHGAMDPHIWMSPRNAQVMVQHIADGLIQVDPDNRAYYEKNRDAYLEELRQLDREIEDALSRLTSRRFMIYHPSLGYFARDYDLTMVAAEEEGKEPSAADIANLIGDARKQGTKVIFASPQLSTESAKVIAQSIGGKVVLVDDLAREYSAGLRALANELVKAME